MKTLTISVADDVFQPASQKATDTKTSLPKVVQELLSAWSQENHRSAAAAKAHQRADLLKFLDELAARPLQSGLSVGPLNRVELCERGIPGH